MTSDQDKVDKLLYPALGEDQIWLTHQLATKKSDLHMRYTMTVMYAFMVVMHLASWNSWWSLVSAVMWFGGAGFWVWLALDTRRQINRTKEALKEAIRMSRKVPRQ